MIAEFKLACDKPISGKWEETNVFCTGHYDGRDEGPRNKAESLAKACRTEVRWNWQGSEQGHYVGG